MAEARAALLARGSDDSDDEGSEEESEEQEGSALAATTPTESTTTTTTTEQQQTKPSDGLTPDQKLKVFKAMLSSINNLALFTTYQKISPELVSDPRFHIIESDTDRKAAFDGWMRARVTRIRKHGTAAEKKEMKRQTEEAFKEMLSEIKDKLAHDTTFDGFMKLCEGDERFVFVISVHESRFVFFLFVQHVATGFFFLLVANGVF